MSSSPADAIRRTELLERRLWTEEERARRDEAAKDRLEALLHSELRGQTGKRPLHSTGGRTGERAGAGVVLFRCGDAAAVKAAVKKELDAIGRKNEKLAKQEDKSLDF